MGKFNTENDLRLAVTGENEEYLVDEKCCTCINVILKNDGQIMTSFLGAHNPEIVKVLEKAQKAYFKELKKTLKKMDTSDHGGAPMLGLNGLVVKSHGNSTAKEIRNSILQCIAFKEQNIGEKISENIKKAEEE